MAKAMAGSPVTMGHPIRRVRVPSLSANSFDSHGMGGSIGRGSDRRQPRGTHSKITVSETVLEYDKAD